MPGSIHIPRSVLEWRVDPDCGFRNPPVCDLEREVILMCADGFSSSFAAVALRELGCGAPPTSSAASGLEGGRAPDAGGGRG